MSRLSDVDLSVSLSKSDGKKQLAAAQERLVHLRLLLGGQIGSGDLGPPLCVLFEGWDASGKGGAITRLVSELDPRHVRVAQFAAPTHDEKRHHFLWRFWPVLPGWGGMAVLDRTWYGRVLVERVEGFATEEAWQRAYGEIVDLETTLAAEGTILVKFWMHVSPEEQLRRFESRRNDPYKAWKLTDEDWRNREKRGAYEAAVEEMLERTDTAVAPWHIVAADDKRWARVDVVRTVNEAIESALKTRGTSGWPSSPPPPTTRGGTTSCGGSGRCCPAGEAWPCSTAPGTAGSWSSGWRASPRRRRGSGPTPRSWTSRRRWPPRARSW